MLTGALKIRCFLIVLYIIITKLYFIKRLTWHIRCINPPLVRRTKLNRIIFGGKNGGYDYEGYGY